jgi:hypothetical protein
MMRLVYFKELINKFKEHHKNSTNSKAEESMMLDYLYMVNINAEKGEKA